MSELSPSLATLSYAGITGDAGYSLIAANAKLLEDTGAAITFFERFGLGGNIGSWIPFFPGMVPTHLAWPLTPQLCVQLTFIAVLVGQGLASIRLRSSAMFWIVVVSQPLLMSLGLGGDAYVKGLWVPGQSNIWFLFLLAFAACVILKNVLIDLPRWKQLVFVPLTPTIRKQQKTISKQLHQFRFGTSIPFRMKTTTWGIGRSQVTMKRIDDLFVLDMGATAWPRIRYAAFDRVAFTDRRPTARPWRTEAVLNWDGRTWPTDLDSNDLARFDAEVARPAVTIPAAMA